MDDLVQFLRDRLDEDEQAAKAALWSGDERWLSFHRGYDDRWIVADVPYEEGVAEVRAHAADDEAVAHHIARHDPARVLAEVEAKRALVDDYERAWTTCAKLSEGGVELADVEEWKRQDQVVQALRPHLMRLADLYRPTS